MTGNRVLTSVEIFWSYIFGGPLYLPLQHYAIFRPVTRRRWSWCRCRHSPGPPLQHAMTSAARRQAGGSQPSLKALVSADTGCHWQTASTEVCCLCCRCPSRVWHSLYSHLQPAWESERICGAFSEEGAGQPESANDDFSLSRYSEEALFRSVQCCSWFMSVVFRAMVIITKSWTISVLIQVGFAMPRRPMGT